MPTTTAPTPIDYSSRDYVSIYNDLLSQIPNFLPEWTSRSTSDFGIALLQLFAWVGDILGYYEDRISNEAFLVTASQPQSVLNIAQMLDYQPLGVQAASTTLQFTTATGSGSITIPARTQVATVGTPTQAPIIFETATALTIPGTTSGPTYVGTVTANEGVTHTSEAVATSDGTASQSYALSTPSVIQGSITVFVDEGQGPTAWLFATHLIDYGPGDRVYSLQTDASGITHILFGDNANGRIPNIAAPITATYRAGTGAVGNVAAGAIVQMVSPIGGVVNVTNTTAASGGANSQSLASIQQQAPASLKALNRAVAPNDFATLAKQVSGVQHAAAQLQTYQLVNLYVAPAGGGNPTTALANSILNYLTGKLMANTTVTIQNPVYVAANITATVAVLSNYGATTTLNAVLNALNALFALSAVDFGMRITVGQIYSAILAVPGVNYATLTASYRQMLATLTAPLNSGTPYTSIPVTPLPRQVNTGDSVVINPGGGSTQTFVASGNAAAGATAIPVTSLVANATYAVGTTVQDPTGVNDMIFLSTEIPIAGTFSITTTGGLIGS